MRAGSTYSCISFLSGNVQACKELFSSNNCLFKLLMIEILIKMKIIICMFVFYCYHNKWPQCSNFKTAHLLFCSSLWGSLTDVTRIKSRCVGAVLLSGDLKGRSVPCLVRWLAIQFLSVRLWRSLFCCQLSTEIQPQILRARLHAWAFVSFLPPSK